MAVVMNQPCPSCQESGHDSTGNHLMVFADGNRLCNRSHFHKNGEVYFVPAGEEDPILGLSINGQVKYTQEQFETLVKEGKLDSPAVRSIALSGMKGQDRWEVSNEEEKDLMLKERTYDEQYFLKLKFRDLIARHIKGNICKFYGIRTGLDDDGKVDRHFYPVYDRVTGEWRGAKCRTLPKDFAYGTLGWTWGDTMLAGQQTLSEVLKHRQMDTLLLVGGECDMMASQQMLLKSQAKNPNWAGKYFHVWSPTKGEMALPEILANRDVISKFKKVILCFDNDEVGRDLTKKVARLFKGTARKLILPSGCKDPNDCLKAGKQDEFVNGWFNPVSPFEGGNIRSMSNYRDKAKEVVEMGYSFPWPSMNKCTHGIRPFSLHVLGAGTGVGKTSITKEIVYKLVNEYKERCMVVYLEDQPAKVVKSFAGFPINKDLTSPIITDKSNPDYLPVTDYTQQESDDAIDALCDSDMIMIGDLEGRKDVDSVMAVIEDGIAMGYQYFFIDNLTAFEHTGKDGKMANEQEAIKETMKRLGTLKDENPIYILLLSHLNRGSEVPHEEGGEVKIRHFMGSSSITFWANGVWGAERNTQAPTVEEKCLMNIRNVKSRDAGHTTGTLVRTKKSLDTGKITQLNHAIEQTKQPESSKDDRSDFNPEY